jgi:hypothetical protein
MVRQNDGIFDSPDIRDCGSGGDTADLATQQEVGLLSARRDQPDHRRCSTIVLDGTFVVLGALHGASNRASVFVLRDRRVSAEGW